MKKRLLAFAFALVPLLCPRPSSAQAPATGIDFSVDDARARFQRGVEFYLEGSFDAAFAEFNKAYELAPNYRVLYNLAQVQTQRHDYVAALKLFDSYLRQAGHELAADRRASVESSIAQLRTRVAVLWVRAPAGAELQIDGVPSGVLPLTAPITVNPGVHQLQLQKTGYEPVVRTVTIASNETIPLELELRPQANTLAPSATLASVHTAPQTRADAALQDAGRVERSGGGNAPMWISLVASAALAGGAVTFGILAHAAENDYAEERNRIPANRSDLEDARDRAKRDAALCDGLAAGAVVSAGLAVYFALSGSSSERPGPSAARLAATARRLEFVQHF